MTRILRWNPLGEMAAMQSAMDRMFDDAWRNIQSTTSHALVVDIYETDHNYVVAAALPGMKSDDIDINFHDGVLIISGEVHKADIPEGARVLVEENFYGKFTRRVDLGNNVDTEKVEANYTDGMLTLTLPKVPEAQPRRIEIKTNGKQLKSGK